MSVFAPINDDHAVESVSFQVVFDEPFGPSAFAAAQSSHVFWRADLPAAQVGNSSENGLPALAFSYMRPDGSHAWQLKFDGDRVEVSCQRYTRWARVWSTASSLLSRAVELVAGAPDMAGASAAKIRLQVVDRFHAPEVHFDAEHLLQPGSGLLPERIFRVGALWHNQSGWFEQSEAGPVLHNLNFVSSRHSDGDDGERRISLSLTHLQELRMRDPIPGKEIERFLGLLETCMADFHARNKRIVADALEPAISRQIGLVSAEHEA